jgi:uncharacterized protein
MKAIIKYPVLSFFTLTFLISWSCFFSGHTFLIYAGLYGPFIAAFIVVAIRDQRVHVRWLNLNLPHVVWIILGILVFPFIWAIGNSGGALFGLVRMAPWQESYWTNLPSITISVIVFTIFIGGGQEEFGWRGFALPELQKSASPLLASILLGTVHAAWHLPLYVNGWYPGSSSVNELLFILGNRIAYNIPTTVIVTFFFNRTQGNLWLMILLHVTHNVNPTPSSEFVLYSLYAAGIALVIVDKMHIKLKSGLLRN